MWFWDTTGGIVIAAAALLVALVAATWIGSFGVAVVNRHWSAASFEQCARLCGTVGVRKADPDFRCECNGTQYIEGHPSLDVNLHGERQ